MRQSFWVLVLGLFSFLISAGTGCAGVSGTGKGNMKAASSGEVRIAVFDMDATPPVGTLMTYDTLVNKWDLGLRAKGVVITGAGEPVVLCAIDWIGLANESQDVFKAALAEAAGTTPGRVAVHTLHQHDAPICDFSAEKLLRDAGMDPYSFRGDFARSFLKDLQQAVTLSLQKSSPVTHIGIGEAAVREVASNRRILVENGKVGVMRGSSCKDPMLRAKPEGVIDSMVTLLSFWKDEKPLAVMSFYAVHPQSYYLTKVANPDFVGLARFYRQLEVPDALHIHFNGAGGNIAAGKYNDGSHENREILARRLAAGMKKAWETSEKFPVSAGDFAWETFPVSLPPALELKEGIEAGIRTGNARHMSNNVPKLVWMNRQQQGKTIDLGCLAIGKSRILFMPGELFVEYQLAAKAMRPDLKVTMAAYGDYGPFYIGTREAYPMGGYEIQVSPVTAEVEEVLIPAIRKLLKADKTK
jgi:hypothetical protein